MYGQGQPLHPCYQVLHAVHGGKVLHYSEIVACHIIYMGEIALDVYFPQILSLFLQL